MSNIDELIEQLRKSADFEDYPIVASFAAIIEKKYLREAADALEKLQAELEQVKQELDAAISDLETIMAYGGGNLDTCQYCKNGQCYARGGTKLCLPQWRGQKED